MSFDLFRFIKNKSKSTVVKFRFIKNKSKSTVVKSMFRVRASQYASKLPILKPDERQIIDTLNTEGVFVTSLDNFKLPLTPQLLKALDGILPEVKANFSVDSPGFNNVQNTYIVHASFEKIAAEYPDIFLWGLQDRLLDIAENYIGLPVALLGVDLKKDIAHESARDGGSKLWHRDGEDIREFKITIYLSDVSEDTISFEYIPRYLTPSIFETFYKSVFLSKNPYKPIKKYNDKQMKHFVPSSQWKRCYGSAGTMFFAGTARMFHRGHLPKELTQELTQDRLALQYTYTSRKPKDPIKCKRHFSKSGLLLLQDKLSERQKECVFWYDLDEG